ncbi:cation/H(+) antiporter 15-like [Telopea speciosissima]|uniref:cation/H(+) antiporter 15-like n=1 Tax=Telopea speciosissima TaxID=54955 RepID=UPI001CC44978|nr:cation/H(+) antiporter 15-like [Telopea speciosissima]
MDPGLIKKSGKKAFAIGISVVMVSLLLSRLAFFLIVKSINPNPTMTHSLPFVGIAEAMISFPVIAHYLTELKIANSDYGRLAMSSSMISGLFSAGLLTSISLFKPGPHTVEDTVLHYLEKIAVTVLLIGVILLVFRPTLLWMIRRYSTGENVNQVFILGVLVTVMMSGFISEHIGQHVILGPLLVGMAIPAGPPLGSALVKRLELIIMWMLMPLYLVKNGLCIDVFAISFSEFAIVEIVILSSCLGKFFGAFFPSLYFRMPLKDALSLGLIMNVQGVLEVTVYRMMNRKKLIDKNSFMVMCISMVVITGVITPLIRAVYDPSRRYVAYKRRTILQLKPNAELRVLACIHNGNHIPAMMNLIEVSNHSQLNPIGVYVLHLVELIGRLTTLLISHDERYKTPPSNVGTLSERVVVAFRNYGKNHTSSLTVQSFTSISSYETMGDDVCTLALNKRVTLIIIPFYEQWTCSGVLLGSSPCRMRSMNSNVLDKAPCSVAVLVDHGRLRSYKHSKEFYVAVFFLGGADDREALAYAARMSENPKVNLTVIRFLPLLQEASVNGDDYMKETKLDNIVVADFRIKMVGNKRVTYKEEVINDGVMTVNFIRSMESDYQLIMVGRRHDEQSPLMVGLAEWNNEETKLLGPIGDYLASPDFRGNATALVVQQQTNAVQGSPDDNLENLIPYELVRVNHDLFKEDETSEAVLIQKS